MEEERIYTIDFTSKDLLNSNFKKVLNNFLNAKLEIQKSKDHYEINESEAELLKLEIVTKDKYNGNTTFEGEIGKLKGKRVVVK